jgi:hypothetical protein
MRCTIQPGILFRDRWCSMQQGLQRHATIAALAKCRVCRQMVGVAWYALQQPANAWQCHSSAFKGRAQQQQLCRFEV